MEATFPVDTMQHYTTFLRCFFIELCLLCTTLLLLFLHDYYSHQNKYHSQTLKTAGSTANNSTGIKVLFWTTAHRLWHWPLNKAARGLVRLDGCNVPCFVTRDRSLIRSADAIVFHDRDADASDLPSYRDERQRWVYWNMEPPPKSPSDRMARLRGVFNWTYTYRHDSDVHHPYFSFVNQSVQGATGSPTRRSAPSVRTNRSKLAVWVATNCHTQSHREDFVTELRKHVAVDVYGRCGDLKCPGDPCQASFGETYYFYLAFENSVCREYATEKFYDALRFNLVPVVIGNYAGVPVPPNSYVDALQFPSPAHLASHLKAVAANTTLYERYFAWKRTQAVVKNRFDDHCALCHALRRASPGGRKSYADIVRWWHGDNGSVCAHRSNGATSGDARANKLLAH
nr:alpha-(1,3)-fucosyltransferase 7-like isoform X2 [Dermacentor andersoni]